MDQDELRTNAHLLVPGLAIVGLKPDVTIHQTNLDVLVTSGGWTKPGDDERVLANPRLVAIGHGSVTADGAPPLGPAGWGPIGYTGVGEFFEGLSDVLVTDRRIFGTLLVGETIFGDVDAHKGRVLAWLLDYEELDYVHLRRKRGAFGKLKDDLILLGTQPPVPSMTLLRLNDGPPRPLMETIVRAACDARAQVEVDAAARARLDAAKSGDWVQEDGDLIAWLSEPDAKTSWDLEPPWPCERLRRASADAPSDES